MYADIQQCTFDVASDYVDLAAEVFRLLADPTRIRIILALREAELTVGAIAEQLDKAPAAVSQHLAKLRWARIVSTRHEGTRVYYSLTDEHARDLVLDAVLQAQHTVDGDAAEHHPSASSVRRARTGCPGARQGEEASS